MKNKAGITNFRSNSGMFELCSLLFDLRKHCSEKIVIFTSLYIPIHFHNGYYKFYHHGNL